MTDLARHMAVGLVFAAALREYSEAAKMAGLESSDVSRARLAKAKADVDAAEKDWQKSLPGFDPKS